MCLQMEINRGWLFDLMTNAVKLKVIKLWNKNFKSFDVCKNVGWLVVVCHPTALAGWLKAFILAWKSMFHFHTTHLLTKVEWVACKSSHVCWPELMWYYSIHACMLNWINPACSTTYLWNLASAFKSMVWTIRKLL